MKGTKARFAFLCLAVSMVVALSAPSLSAASPNHTRDTFVENFDIVVPAEEGCSGEDVHIFGTLDLMIQTTTDGKGKLHVVFHLTPHLTGVGLLTGLEYNPVGPTNTVDMIDANGPRISKGINIVNLISRGSAGNLVIQEHINLTVNANGTPTVEFDDIKGGCRG
jgi:hypothetical protein